MRAAQPGHDERDGEVETEREPRGSSELRLSANGAGNAVHEREERAEVDDDAEYAMGLVGGDRQRRLAERERQGDACRIHEQRRPQGERGRAEQPAELGRRPVPPRREAERERR